MEDFLGIRRDTTQLSTNFRVELAELKNLLLNIPGNKRRRKQMRKNIAEQHHHPWVTLEGDRQWKFMIKFPTKCKHHGTACVHLGMRRIRLHTQE
jgi:hypothetical protein